MASKTANEKRKKRLGKKGSGKKMDSFERSRLKSKRNKWKEWE